MAVREKRLIENAVFLVLVSVIGKDKSESSSFKAMNRENKYGLVCHADFDVTAISVLIAAGATNSFSLALAVTLDDGTRPANATTVGKNERSLIPIIINHTHNTNATSSASQNVRDALSKDNSAILSNISLIELQANNNALKIIPNLVNVLKNTNATSVTAEYVINITEGSNSSAVQSSN